MSNNSENCIAVRRHAFVIITNEFWQPPRKNFTDIEKSIVKEMELCCIKK